MNGNKVKARIGEFDISGVQRMYDHVQLSRSSCLIIYTGGKRPLAVVFYHEIILRGIRINVDHIFERR